MRVFGSTSILVWPSVLVTADLISPDLCMEECDVVENSMHVILLQHKLGHQSAPVEGRFEPSKVRPREGFVQEATLTETSANLFKTHKLFVQTASALSGTSGSIGMMLLLSMSLLIVCCCCIMGDWERLFSEHVEDKRIPLGPRGASSPSLPDAPGELIPSGPLDASLQSLPSARLVFGAGSSEPESQSKSPTAGAPGSARTLLSTTCVPQQVGGMRVARPSNGARLLESARAKAPEPICSTLVFSTKARFMADLQDVMQMSKQDGLLGIRGASGQLLLQATVRSTPNGRLLELRNAGAEDPRLTVMLSCSPGRLALDVFERGDELYGTLMEVAGASNSLQLFREGSPTIYVEAAKGTENLGVPETRARAPDGQILAISGTGAPAGAAQPRPSWSWGTGVWSCEVAPGADVVLLLSLLLTRTLLLVEAPP